MNSKVNKSSKVHKRVAKGVYKRISSSGQTYYLVYCGRNTDGSVIWEKADTEDEAKAQRKQVTTATANEGKSLFVLNADQRNEAHKCYKKLKPYNAHLATAVDYYVEHVLKYATAPTIKEMVDVLVGGLIENNRRPRSIQDAKNRLERFAAAFGNRKLSEITPEELESWLSGLGKAAGTKINYKKRLHQLWSFAIRKRWCAENVVNLLDPISADQRHVHVFSIAQCKDLLKHANSVGLLPYIALGLFAGLRPAEAERLTWDAVKLTRRAIIIDHRVAKKRSQRVITPTDALVAWIIQHLQPEGPVTPSSEPSLRWRLDLLKETAGILKWPYDGLRHTFGSYHFALHKNAELTASEMGNSVDVVHRHYKALVDPEDVTRFWDLRPI